MDIKNTFTQLDQFEVLTVTNAKNKHVYDFSHSSANENGSNSSIWMIKNKINRLTNMTTIDGDDAVRPITFGDPSNNNTYGPIYTAASGVVGLTQGALLTSGFPTSADNSGIKNSPNINEDCLIYLGYTGETSVAPTSYRSGYIELSFRTDKQNCIVGYGSSIIKHNLVNGVLMINKTINNNEIEDTASKDYSVDTDSGYISELSVNVKGGKLNLSYTDDYGINQNSFEITGNQSIADNLWHHVVINFGRPGLIKNRTDKFEDKTVEFWIDGKLDKRTSDYTNNHQIFFPEILWLGANPKKLFNTQFNQSFYDGFNSQDENYFASNNTTANIWNGSWPSSALTDAFHGSIRTFAHGINFPLDKFEIQERFKFWNYDELPFRDSLTASAVMVQPTVTVNSKRALKLFWNDAPMINGIELDNNFIVDAYSVTHKNKNSATETYNLDIAKKKDYTVLTNVRVVAEDNVTVWSPAGVSPQNLKGSTAIQGDANRISGYTGFQGSLISFTFSGVELNNNDRVLLTNQINESENGIWIFNGKESPLTRSNDADSPTKINNAIVYVTEGTYAETYWTLDSNIQSFNDAQSWSKLTNKPETTIYSQPFFTSKWSDAYGVERLINLQQDVNLANYDLIVFMNYPETSEDIDSKLYKDFIASVKAAVVGGASLYVSSPRLALDLGIASKFTAIPQLTETSDAQSAAINPFEVGEPAARYFDTHRNNQHQLQTVVAGLTNKATYLLTDFISYKAEDLYDYDQYHAKYLNRPSGILEGNTFFIPGLALMSQTENANLPGYRNNYRGTKDLNAIDPADLLSGTIVTKLANNYYNGSTVTVNPYDDYATTIVIQPGQTLGGTGITGKVFVNCVEDGYTMSREEYNKAVIQVVPTPDTNETTNTRLWQYSTRRLNRLPRRTNIRGLTEFGQTTPTNGGGGPIVQAPSNASNGVIRSATDKDNVNYQSDLYPTEAEEIYTTQEIPVLSMTYLGLQWLAE